MAAQSGTAVEAEGLVKSFRGTRAVDGIDMHVPAGSVVGLLGPNGAGKTTTIRILATLLQPDAGTGTVFGHDVARMPDAVRRRISLTGQFASIDDDLSGLENLLIQARLRGYSRPAARQRAADLLERFDLTEAAHRQVRTYSGGMQRRLDIAVGIVVTPELLFLDEPTTGLDPRSRTQVWQTVRELVAQGTTVLLTTQYLDEADRLCDRIAVVDHGRIVADDTPARLKSSVGNGVLHVHLAEPHLRPSARELLADALRVPVELDPDPAALRVRLGGSRTGSGGAAQVTHALAQLSSAGFEVSAFALGQPSLDEVFLALTGNPARMTGPDSEKEVA